MTTSGNDGEAETSLPRFDYHLTDQPDPADIALIEDRLTIYNEQAARPYDIRPLCIFLRDEQGKTLGGVTGYTNWGWLYLDCFWLPDEVRARKGVGSRILSMAEQEARARGCTHVRLFTYSFQAPGFYAARGYEAFGELRGYPPGHSQIWLKKALI